MSTAGGFLSRLLQHADTKAKGMREEAEKMRTEDREKKTWELGMLKYGLEQALKRPWSEGGEEQVNEIIKRMKKIQGLSGSDTSYDKVGGLVGKLKQMHEAGQQKGQAATSAPLAPSTSPTQPAPTVQFPSGEKTFQGALPSLDAPQPQLNPAQAAIGQKALAKKSHGLGKILHPLETGIKDAVTGRGIVSRYMQPPILRGMNMPENLTHPVSGGQPPPQAFSRDEGLTASMFRGLEERGTSKGKAERAELEAEVGRPLTDTEAAYHYGLASAPTAGKFPKPVFKGEALVGIEDPSTGKTYTDPQTMPPDIRKVWDDIHKEVATEEKRKTEDRIATENRAFNHHVQAMTTAFQNAMASSDYKAAQKIVNDSKKDYDGAVDRMKTMDKNLVSALRGDQQAMLSLVANHIGMTLGAQKGARITRAVWEEAIQSAPWLASKAAKFDERGYLSGVTLTTDQMHQMVNLAHEKVDILHDHVGRVEEEYQDALGARGPSKKRSLPSLNRKPPKTADEYLSAH